MKCQDCDQPATVHAAALIDGQEQELHLCRACAEKRHVIETTGKPHLPGITKQLANATVVSRLDVARLACPDCHMTFMEFRQTGRLGCPYDYLLFREGLIPLLQRIQRASRHTGKKPRHLRGTVEFHGEIRYLRRQLRCAVEGEDFAEAARLRDVIRAKELGDGRSE